MLKVALVLVMVYGIAWIVSTPETRAAAKPGMDRIGKTLLAVQAVAIGAAWLYYEMK